MGVLSASLAYASEALGTMDFLRLVDDALSLSEPRLKALNRGDVLRGF